MGGYAGQYSFLPYNEKVQEYIDSESRDLWEYTLDFTPEESRRLVDHLWELEANSWFDYYFINKNCSYQLLTAIEVVKPEWDLSSDWLWVVPAETVKRVKRIPGAITRIRYRPSLRKIMVQALDRLTPEERAQFEELVHQRLAPARVSSPAVLTAAIQYAQYHRAESEGVNRTDLQDLFDRALERRAELGASQRIETYQEPPPGHPEDGHGPITIGLAQGLAARTDQASQLFEELKVRPAYHDLLNNDLGYPSFSEIDFPNLTLRYYPQTSSFALEQLQLMEMFSVRPLDYFEKRWSWKVDIEVEQPKDLACANCYLGHAEIAWGPTFRLFSPQWLFYTVLGPYFEAGGGLSDRPVRYGPGGEAGILANPWQPYKLRLRALSYGDIFQPYRAPIFGELGFDQAISWSAHWESRLEARQVFTAGASDKNLPSYYDAKVSLQYYF
jgi:hypothetical protein